MMKLTFGSILFALLFVASMAHAGQADKWSQLRPLLAAAAPVEGSDAVEIPQSGPVVVTFFASWCPPCTDEFGHLNALLDQEGEGELSVVAVNLFEAFGGELNPARMARFLDRTGPKFGLVQGSGEIGKAFGDIDRIPTVIVYGRSGDEVWRFVHERGAKKTHATLADLTEALTRARAQ